MAWRGPNHIHASVRREKSSCLRCWAIRSADAMKLVNPSGMGLRGKVRPAYLCVCVFIYIYIHIYIYIYVAHKPYPQNWHAPSGFVMTQWWFCDLWQISWVSWSPMLMQLTTLTVPLPPLPLSDRAAWEQTKQHQATDQVGSKLRKTLAWPIGPFRTL